MSELKYPRCRKNGRVLIISVDSYDDDTRVRPYNEKDVALVYDTFRSLEYDVNISHNPTKRKLLEIIRDESLKESLKDHTAFICFLMTRYDKGVGVKAKDGYVPLDSVYKLFNGQACPALTGKPKLFFVNVTGNEKMTGEEMVKDSVEFDSEVAPPDPEPTVAVPSEADILVMYSTVPGYASYQKKKTGCTRFIEGLCDAISRYGPEHMDVMRVLTRATHSVAIGEAATDSGGKHQVPQIVSTLTKELYM